MNGSISLISVFFEGLLSFFSPCVLPLIPIYIGYLTVDGKKVNEDGTVKYNRFKVFITTLFFVLGICTTFFILGLSTSAFKSFFTNNSLIFTYIGAFILIILGLSQLEIINFPFLQKEKRINSKIDLKKMNFLKAFVLGFLFSFAWTPCIGPMLSSALVMAANASTIMQGNLYILAYSLGFIITFLMLGLFTEEILNLLSNHKNIVKYSVKIGGIIILAMGIYLFYDASRQVHALENRTEQIATGQSETANDSTLPKDESSASAIVGNDTMATDIEKHDFILNDADGNPHQLTEYAGKPVIITFFGTWCTYCQQELVILDQLDENNKDIQIILLARPNDGSEGSIEDVVSFMKEKNYDNMLVLYDTTGEVFNYYGISGFPTTYVYKSDKSLLGYVPGYIQESELNNIIDEALK